MERALAFTLVELLVVISILGLLAGLSIPAITKAQASARTSASMSNLKQIHVLMQNYLAENNGIHPKPVYWSGENSGV
jgi:prepilin-type N-terminal cleavage/methylation domain-containing protein